MHRAKATLACLLVLLGLASGASAQAPVLSDPGLASLEDFSGGVSLSPGGAYFNFRKFTGNGVGFQNGYQQLGVFYPWWYDADTLFAADARILLTDNSRIGFNAGGIARRYFAEQDRFYGVHGWFDSDDTTLGNRFQQAAFGLESVGWNYDLRINGYVPVGDRDTFVCGTSISPNPMLFGNNILFPALQQIQEAMPGADIEWMVPLLPNASWLRGGLGVYAYSATNNDDPIGGKGRLEAWVSNDLHLQVQATQDEVYGTNVNFIMDFRFSGFTPTRYFPNWTTRERMTIPVERNYRVATQVYNDETFVVGRNPTTLQPLFIVFVDNSNPNPGPGTGTFENPFKQMPTSAPQADIVFVYRGNSTAAAPYPTNFTMVDNQRLLGEGRFHTVDLVANEFCGPTIAGTFGLPIPGTANTNTGNFPFLSNPSGNVITLANNNEVSAFNILNSGGNAIVSPGAGSNGFNLNYLNITNNAGGIFLANASGNGVIRNVNLFGNTNGGIVLDTGATPLNLELTNVNSGGSPLGPGIRLTADNSALTATMTNVAVTGNQRGIEINGVNQSVTVAGTTVLSNANVGNNLNIDLTNSPFTGTFVNSSFSDSVTGSGIVVTQRGQVGTLNLAGVAADSNAVDGMRLNVQSFGDLTVNVDNSSFRQNGRDGLNAATSGGSVLDLTVNTSQLSGNGRNGYTFDATGASGLGATFNQSNLSNNGQYGVFGTANNSTAILNMDVATVNSNGRDGLFVTGTSGATVLGTITNSAFSDNGRNAGFGNAAGMRLVATGGSLVSFDVTDSLLNNTPGSATQDYGLLFDASGGGTLAYTMTRGSLSDNTVNAINGNVTGGANATVTLTDVFADRGGVDGLRFTANGGLLTFDMTGGSVSNSGANGLRTDITNGATGDFSFTNVRMTDNGADGINASVTNATMNLDLTGTVLDANAGRGVAIDSTNSVVTGTWLNSSTSGNAGGAGISLIASGGTANFVMNGVQSNSNNGSGIDFELTNGQFLGLTYDNGQIIGNNGDGVQGTVDGPGTLAVLSFTGTRIDNNLGAGYNVTPTNGGRVITTFNGSSISGNGTSGLVFNVAGPSRADLTMTNTTVDNNRNGAGLEFNVTNGGVFTATVLGGSFSGNGTQSPADGVRGFVEGTDANGNPSTAVVLFDGTAADRNSLNGYNFIVRNQAVLSATLETTGNNGTLSASNNALEGVRLEATNAGNAQLIMSGGNQINNNGTDGITMIGTDSDSVFATVSGTISGNGADGVSLTMDGVQHARFALTVPSLIEQNGGNGVDLAFTNTTVDVLSIAGVVIQNNGQNGVNMLVDNSSIPAGAIVNDVITGNTLAGVNVVSVNNSNINLQVQQNLITNNGTAGVRFNADSGNATLDILTNTATGNPDVGIDIILSGTAVAALNINGNTVGASAITPPVGGSVIRQGFNTFSLPAVDDVVPNPTATPLGFTADFFGTNYTDTFVNINGNITFNNADPTFTPFNIITSLEPIIAPFFADVDTRAGNQVTYGQGTVNGRAAFGVNWIDVRHFDVNQTGNGLPTNTFQLVLIDRSDVNPGDFDIEFNYGTIQWEAGQANGSDPNGLNPTPGQSARAGYSTGSQAPNPVAFELPGAGVTGAYLDNGPPQTSLVQNSLNSGVLGRYVFEARNGTVVNPTPQVGTNDGIRVTMTDSATLQPSDINNNTVSGYNRHGININATDNTLLQNLRINGNSVTGVGASGVNLDLAGAARVDNLTVNNNTSTGNGADGVRVAATGGSVIQQSTVNGNTLSNNTLRGLNVEQSQSSDVTMTIRNNTIDSNDAEGARINLTDFSTFNNPDFSGNTVTNNGSFGLFVQALDNSVYSLNLGAAGSGPAFTNTFDANTFDGIRLQGLGNSIGLVDISNTVVTGTTGRAPPNGANGIAVMVQDNAQLPGLIIGDPTVQNTSFTANEGDGIFFLAQDSSSLANFVIQNVDASSNGVEGIGLDRRDQSTMNGSILNSTANSNGRDGLRITANNQPAPILDLTVNDSTFNSNLNDGMNFVLIADATVVVNANRNTANSNAVNGVEVTTFNTTAFGDPNTLTPSRFNNTILNGNGNNGVNLVANDSSFLLVAFDSPAGGVRTTMDGNVNNGVQLVANANSQVGLSINAADIINTTGGATNDGINLITNGASNVGVSITDTTLGSLAPTFGSTGLGGDGLDVSTNAVSHLTLVVGDGTADNVRIYNNAGDGIRVRNDSTDQTTSTDSFEGVFQGVSARFNGQRGFDALLTGTVGGRAEQADPNTPVTYTITNGNFSDNTLEGIFYQTNPGRIQNMEVLLQNTGATDPANPATVTNDLLPPYDPRWETFVGPGSGTVAPGQTGGAFAESRYDGANYPWNNFYVEQASVFSVTNSLIQNNGENGMVLQVATNSYVAADVSGNTYGGNRLADFNTSSFITTNAGGAALQPNASINRTGVGTFDSVFLDDTAQLDLRFQGNVGDQINVTALGAFYTNTDPGKQNADDGNAVPGRFAFTRPITATQRRADVFVLDDAFTVNTTNNFTQFGVTQDLVFGPQGFFTNGYSLRTVPNWGDPNFPPPVGPTYIPNP